MATSFSHDQRPDPEELLDRYHLRDIQTRSAAHLEEDEEASGQPFGRLRIYLGMAAGVGKTYAMLNEGRRRKARGADVVIGFVETHGRPITEQQIGDLEIIPRKKMVYRSIVVEEMDVEAILTRHPQIVLVDELAHTNVPGSRHAKRYQDVEELRQAGIIVLTTLNIQHLEGLNDIVEAITGVHQRETVPDAILDEAEEVELVDIAPDALRARLRHGNVYPPERAQQALRSYFSQSNLTALRELALRRTAEKTEDQLEAMMRPQEWGGDLAWKSTATERVLVAFDDRPHASNLIRAGWRLARGLKAPILALIVERGRWSLRQKVAIREHLQLATDLGAEVIQVTDRDVAAAIVRTARAYAVTQIVIGQPMRSWWEEFWRPSVAKRLLHMSTGAAIYIVPADEHNINARNDMI
jgi:two-component system, OmpR family, sensor histidine kinase KdpD